MVPFTCQEEIFTILILKDLHHLSCTLGYCHFCAPIIKLALRLHFLFHFQGKIRLGFISILNLLFKRDNSKISSTFPCDIKKSLGGLKFLSFMQLYFFYVRKLRHILNWLLPNESLSWLKSEQANCSFSLKKEKKNLTI